jgi:hypothetical protein
VALIEIGKEIEMSFILVKEIEKGNQDRDKDRDRGRGLGFAREDPHPIFSGLREGFVKLGF